MHAVSIMKVQCYSPSKPYTVKLSCVYHTRFCVKFWSKDSPLILCDCYAFSLLCVVLESFCVLNASISILFTHAYFYAILTTIKCFTYYNNIQKIMKVTLHNLYIKCKSILFTINSINTRIIVQYHHQPTDVTLEFIYLCTYMFPLPQLLHVYDLNAQQLLLKILYNSLKQLYLIKGMLLRHDRISPKSRTDHH